MTAITGLLLGEKGSSYALYYWLSGWEGTDIKFLMVSFVIFDSKILFAFAAFLTVLTGYAYFRVGFRNM